MKTIGNEDVTESIDDHFYKFDSLEVLERNWSPLTPAKISPRLHAGQPHPGGDDRPPPIPERRQAVIHTLVSGTGWDGGGYEGASGGLGGGFAGLLTIAGAPSS